MNELVSKMIREVLAAGRPCPYAMRDGNWDAYCSTFLETRCGYQGDFCQDKDRITYRPCRKEAKG